MLIKIKSSCSVSKQKNSPSVIFKFYIEAKNMIINARKEIMRLFRIKIFEAAISMSIIQT